MPFALDLASLSLAPPDATGRGLFTMGKDVLRCWPHDYNSAQENALWAHDEWPQHLGRAAHTKHDCAFEQYTMNYTFHALYPWVPSGTTRDGKAVLYSADSQGEVERKRLNFYRAMAYIRSYPEQTNQQLQSVLGCSKGVFIQQVIPTLFSLADHISFLDMNLRLWEYNHTEHFLERVTFSIDGFPITVSAPTNRFLARLLYGGKYKTFVVKGEYMIALGPGFPINYCGPHIGIRHDSRLWKRENPLRRAKIYKWEYGLGDKAYKGCPEMLTEYIGKRANLSHSQLEWNLTVQHYRGRVEHAISELVRGKHCLTDTWRGDFLLLACVMKICAHMVGLQERMKGPKYDVFGPWPVCPANVVAMYP